MFDTHFDGGLYTSNFYLLDHVKEDTEKFGSLKRLDISTFGRFNVHIKRAYTQS